MEAKSHGRSSRSSLPQFAIAVQANPVGRIGPILHAQLWWAILKSHGSRWILRLLTASLGVSCGILSAADFQSPDPMKIRVQASEHDRLATPVSIEVSAAPANWGLTDPQGTIIPHQLTDDNRIEFRVGHLEKGESVVYTYGPRTGGPPDTRLNLIVHYDEDALRFSKKDSDLFAYRIAPPDLSDTGIDPLYRRAGYIHPLKTLKGHLVTDELPPDHLHQNGVFSAWTRAVFDGRKIDFWNLKDGTGRVDVLALEHAWEGPVNAGFVVRHQFTDLTTGKSIPVLNETWTVRAYAPDERDNAVWYLDLHLDQVTASKEPLELPEYRYGGFSMRGNRDWLGEENARFLTADGVRDRVLANATRSRWCAISGGVGDERAGLAILDHPSNFRSPQPLRVHPTMPYFCYAPPQIGPFTIAIDQPYQASYRIVIFDGEPDPKTIDRIWTDFADPPMVEVIIE